MSLRSWFYLRLCVMDFGRKFMNRIFIYSSAFLGAYLFYTVMLVLAYLQFVALNFSNIINFYGLYDVCIIMTVMLIMLNYGAVINH